MSAGSSSTRLTPAMAASSGSAPCRMRRNASSTALSPFADETATGREGFCCARPACARAAAAAAEPNSFLRESVMRAAPYCTGDPQARHFRAASGIASRHSGQLLVAGAAAGRSRISLVSTNTASAMTKKSSTRPARSPYLIAFCPESAICALRHSPPGSANPITGISTSSTMPETTLPMAAPITTPMASANAFCLSRNSRNSFVDAFMKLRSHTGGEQASRCCGTPPSVLSPERMERPQVSVVIPLFNEEENVRALLDELFAELQKLGRSYEVICVDDGSRDRTFPELARIAAEHPELRVIRFRLNFGQTAAMSAGIEAALGEVIVPMDGDLQNDPADIGKLLSQLDTGYDVVSGWRKNRQDRE